MGSLVGNHIDMWVEGRLAGQQTNRHGQNNLDEHPRGWTGKTVRVSDRIDTVNFCNQKEVISAFWFGSVCRD